jgi:23S rRNA (uracil1939-C5)-methyltransferase
VDSTTTEAGKESRDREQAILELGAFDSHGITRARYHGRSIEVEHGIPGEVVRAEVLGSKRLRGHILEILQPSAERVEPPCIYFKDWACGGCQWQQLDYEAQLETKRIAVDAEMERAGLEIRVSAAHYLDNPWRYRSTAGISLGRSAGFRRHGSLAIVPIRDCPISHPLIGRLMGALNDLIASRAIPDFRGRVRLEVRLAGLTEEDTRLHVLIRPDREYRPPGEDLTALQKALSDMHIVGSVSLTRLGGGVDVLSGDRFAPTKIEGKPVWLASASFFQTNQRLLPDLIGRLREESTPRQGKRIADAYGGVGIFGLFLADEAAEVTIVETDSIAVEAGRRTAETWDLNNVRFVEAPAGEALAGTDRYDIVVVDPPRAGLDIQVLNAISETKPALLLYISCLAESLARDLQILEEARYETSTLELFDFYPQTYHVELLAALRQGE